MSDRLENNKVAVRYARALFESVLSNGDIHAVAADLQTVSDVFAQVPALGQFFENPGIPEPEKLKLVEEQFGKVNPWVLRLLRLMAENGRMPVVPQLAQQYTELLNRHQNVTRAEVVTATELEAELKARIQKTLESSMGFTKVELQNKVDPGILGGAIIKIQDKVIDGSFVGRLEELRKQLVKS